MAFKAFFVVASIFGFLLQSGVVSGQTKTSTTASTSTTTAQWIDPTTGGKAGNPGSRIHLTVKAIDAITSYGAEAISNQIRNFSIPDLNLPVGLGILTIKSPRISDVVFPSVQNELVSPNRIRTRFLGGKITADGSWQFKSIGADPKTGGFRVTIANGEMETTNQMGRTNDAKPMLQTVECKASFRDFQVQVDGAPGLDVLKACKNNPICDRIRAYFEEIACNILRTFIKESINRQLATFPSRVKLNCTTQFYMDYGLMSDPKVAADCIQAGLEGRVLWRNTGTIPFSANDLPLLTNKETMVIFELGDYAFNTLFYQAHAQQYEFSADDSLPTDSPLRDFLKLNCGRKVLVSTGLTVATRQQQLCLGSIFNNVASNQYANNASGDLVYKTNRRPMRVFLQGTDGDNFDGSGGVLEVYGPSSDQNGKRQLLARADVRLLRGDFVPTFDNGIKISGFIRINTIQLAQWSSQNRALNDQWLTQLAEIATPVLTKTFDVFLARVAQFPIPLLDGYECTPQQFKATSRSVRVDCDIRFKQRRHLIEHRSCQG